MTDKTRSFIHQLQRFFSGAAVALGGVQIATTWTTICGVSPVALLSLFSAGALALLAVQMLHRNAVFSTRTATIALAVCGVALSWTLPAACEAIFQTNIALTAEWPAFCFVLPACLCAGMIAAMALWLTNGLSRSMAGPIGDLTVTCGLCIGLLASFLQAVAVFPLSVVVCATCLAATGLRTFTRHNAASAAGPTESESVSSKWSGVVSATGLGIFVASGTAIVSTLIPVTFVVLVPAFIITLVGCLLIATAVRRGWVAGAHPRIAASLCPLALPLCFGALTEFHLRLNAETSSVLLLTSLRALQLAAVWLAGWLCHAVVCQSKQPGRGNVPFFRNAGLLCLGLAVTVLLRINCGLTAGVGLALGFAMICCPLVQTLRGTAGHRLVGGATAITCAGLLFLSYPRATATQLLFSTQAAQSYRDGTDVGVIAQANGFRLMAEQDTPHGFLTVWKTSGDQVLLRRNGWPAGETSLNVHTTPQPVADILPTLLPLVMHPKAASLLLLGDETGSAARLCTDFPLHTIVASRPDPETTRFAEESVWKAMSVSPREDDRITIRTEPVAITVRRPTSAGQFDVIVANSPHPASLGALSELTPEFYAAVRRRLSQDGVFCQRISRHDLGAVPLVRIISTLAEQFGRVVMVQMVSGELAVVASVEPNALLDSELLSRMERRHVMRTLSGSGWDWSQIAALAAVDTNDPIGIFEHTERLPAAWAGSAHFAFALPVEVCLRNDKNAEVRQMFAPHQQRVADAADKGAAYPEFARRLSAVINQSEILSTFPDQPWPYRRSLRTEMQRNPRPPVEVTRNGKTEQVPDPRDERRKSYFVALGQVLQQVKAGMVDPLSLRDLAGFTQTYEPLLSYFAHHELIRIHETAGHPSPAMELRHRLHTVYFAESGDHSIRQLTDALSQLLDDPELVTSVELRYDHVNSMLQKLVQRWNLRRNYEPRSALQAQQDVEASIAVAKRGLNALNELSEGVGIRRSEIAARRKYIHRSLVSPLRTYQEQVLAHRIKNESPVTPVVEHNSDSSDDLPLLLTN